MPRKAFVWHIVAQTAFVLACGESVPTAGDDPTEPVRHDCPRGGPGFSPPHEIPKAHVKESYSGTNGVFIDTCQGGDLVQYGCEETSTEPNPFDPAIYTYTTGAVTSRNVDCGGRCIDGACPNVCPAVGDELRYLSVEADGRATLESISSGWTYACSLNPSGECLATPRPGDIVNVTGTQTPGLYTGDECAEEIGMSVGVGTEATCWYNPCVPSAP
jgi:hypothetical protein